MPKHSEHDQVCSPLISYISGYYYYYDYHWPGQSFSTKYLRVLHLTLLTFLEIRKVHRAGANPTEITSQLEISNFTTTKYLN